MKVTNIILSILILVLALVSAAFSYFLFEKRDSLVKGWEKLAVAINGASTSMDRTSGTQIAKSLTPAELSHEKYAELDAKLAKLASQTRQIIAERDEMAEALRRIGMAVDVKNLGSDAEFRGVATYRTNVDNVTRGVSKAVQKRDLLCRELAKLAGRTLNITVNPKALAECDQAELGKIVSALNLARNRRRTYESTLRTIGSHANVSSSDFSDSNYSRSAERISAGVAKVRRDVESANNALDNVRRELVGAKAEIRRRQSEIEKLNKRVDDLNYDVNKYKVALGVAKEDAAPIPWRPGSPEVRANTVGEVVKVDNNYGYIAINLGKNTLVTQALGEKSITVNPMIVSGMEMVVARGKLNEGAEFVARVKLDEVGDECTTANIPAGSNRIKVGDIVYFDNNVQQKK